MVVQPYLQKFARMRVCEFSGWTDTGLIRIDQSAAAVLGTQKLLVGEPEPDMERMDAREADRWVSTRWREWMERHRARRGAEL